MKSRSSRQSEQPGERISACEGSAGRVEQEAMQGVLSYRTRARGPAMKKEGQEWRELPTVGELDVLPLQG